MSSGRYEVIAHRAWNFLRLSLLWPRKSGLFHRRVGEFLRRLRGSTPRLQPNYAERQFSFGETPVFQVKMHCRPAAVCFHIPCINPKVDFDFQFGSCVDDEYGSFHGYGSSRQDEEDGIDFRAEKFITTFYEQMKMQTQISYLPYDRISDE